MAWNPQYTTIQELQSWVRDATTASDAELLLAIEAASRSIDRACNRQFGKVSAPQQRFYTAEYHQQLCRWVVDIDDLMTQTGLLIHADLNGDETYGYVIDNFTLKPSNGAVNNRPWTRFVVNPASANRPNNKDGAVRVTATFGWTAVPDTIIMATLLQASRLFARREAPFGIAGNPDVGELRLLEKVDPDVMVSLRPYVRHWGAV